MLRIQDVQHPRQTDGKSVRLLHRASWGILSIPSTSQVRLQVVQANGQWIALQNNPDGTGPLASYFQGEQLNTGRADSFTGNM